MRILNKSQRLYFWGKGLLKAGGKIWYNIGVRELPAEPGTAPRCERRRQMPGKNDFVHYGAYGVCRVERSEEHTV